MNNQLREIVRDMSLWTLATEEELKPFDINAGPCYIIEKSYVEYMIRFMTAQSTLIERLQSEVEVYKNYSERVRKELEKKGSDIIDNIETQDLILRMSLWAVEQGRFGNVHS